MRVSPPPESFLPLKPMEFSILLALAETDGYGYATTGSRRWAGGWRPRRLRVWRRSCARRVVWSCSRPREPVEREPEPT